jgi:phosphatidylethanolamine/phosphatidyl-N-methylethanolamine N-methyltransferase
MDSDNYYENVYSKVNDQGLVGRISIILHKSMESQINPNHRFNTVLELGAGKGQHKNFVTKNYSDYWETDIREKNKFSDSQNSISEVKTFFLDAEDLSVIQDQTVDRIIATCLLAHLSSPETALREWRRVLTHKGIVTIYVPCEPGILLRIARMLSTIPKAKKLKFDQRQFIYDEHIQYFQRLEHLIKGVFNQDKVQVKGWPLSFLPWDLCLWKIFHIQISKKDLVE